MFRRARSLYSSSGRDGTLVRAVVGSAGLRVAGMGLGFLVGVQLARSLGPAGYGIYGIAMSLVSLAAIPSDLGLSLLVTRESAIAEASVDRSRIRSLMNWTFRFVLANTAVVIVIALAAVTLNWSAMNGALKPALLYGLAMLPLAAIAGICGSALRGMQHVIKGQLFDMLLRPGLVSLGLFAFWISGDAHALTPSLAMALNLLATVVGAGFMLCWLAPLLRGVPIHPLSRDTRRRWLHSAIPLALSEGMRVVLGNLAILILGLLAQPAEVGLYRVAAGIYTTATLPSALLSVACSPMLAGLYAEGKKDAIQRVNAWMALLLVFAAIAWLIPFVLMGSSILSIAFGHSYAAANICLIILLAGELAAAFIGHPIIVLNMLHHEKAVTKFSLVALLINVGISMSLVPIYGGVGAAVGAALSQLTWRFLCRRYALQNLGLESSLLAWRKG